MDAVPVCTGSAGGRRQGMKAVLISIRPEWVRKILNGSKTKETKC